MNMRMLATYSLCITGEQTLMPAAQSGALTFDSTKLSYLMETLLDDDEVHRECNKVSASIRVQRV